MNKRILELAEQTFYYGNWEGDGIFTGQVDLEKFAELIVRECIKATGNCAGTGDMIKEHFGVK